jgi:hypothetical protein
MHAAAPRGVDVAARSAARSLSGAFSRQIDERIAAE